MKQIEEIIDYLKNYNGETIRLMEVCGSHTAAIAKFGIKDMLSSKIHLVSGPGCPVCVTPTSYIDRLIELAKSPDTCVVTFGDLLRVPGSRQSLNQAKGEGAKIKMVYSPIDIIKLAKENSKITYIFAAVGFETTAPVYALLMSRVIKEEISNIKLLTALKTMPEAIRWLCKNGAEIDGFIAPGHVCVITGSDAFQTLAHEFGIPFGVAGFQAQELMIAIYGILQMVQAVRNKEYLDSDPFMKNFYPSAVTSEGNTLAQRKVSDYFEVSDAVWRGMGTIEHSGMILKQEYQNFDAGSSGLVKDDKMNHSCCCDKILMGKMAPVQCPLFQKECNPSNPQGACMVSTEGSCYQQFTNETL